AITKLGSVIDVYGNARELLDHVLAGESRMPRRAARGDLKRRNAFEVGFGDVVHLVEKHAAGVKRDASLHSVADGTRLLVNFLEPEMLGDAVFRDDRIPRDPLDRRLYRVAFEVDDAHGVLIND